MNATMSKSEILHAAYKAGAECGKLNLEDAEPYACMLWEQHLCFHGFGVDYSLAQFLARLAFWKGNEGLPEDATLAELHEFGAREPSALYRA